MNNTFSIVIPVYNRVDGLRRAVESLINQSYSYEDYEIIIIDDGSTDETIDIVREYEDSYMHIRTVRFSKNRGRLAARNAGMEFAEKDWICWLDSDDEYITTYLEMMNNAINRFPDRKIFNFGAVVYDEQNFHSWERGTFRPETKPDLSGHVEFKSGGIGSGSFIFRRELLERTGFLPEATSPYGDDNSFPALATKKYPQIEALYGKTEEGHWKPFGNPWGDDWLMFYLLTRENISEPLDLKPYLQHLRR